MKKEVLIAVFLCFCLLVKAQILTVESIDKKVYQRSIDITKMDFKDNSCLISLSFSPSDSDFVKQNINSKIYLGWVAHFKPAIKYEILPESNPNATRTLLLVFDNIIDSFGTISLMSECDSCFYFKGIHVSRDYHVIFMTTGEVVKAKIVETDDTEMKYQGFDPANQEIIAIPKSQISFISYKSGKTENVTAKAEEAGITPDKICEQAKIDAQINYKTSAGYVNFCISGGCNPLFGVISTLIYIAQPPKDENLKITNYELAKNPAYKDCYREEAYKKEKRSAWIGFVAGIPIYAVFIYINFFVLQ